MKRVPSTVVTIAVAILVKLNPRCRSKLALVVSPGRDDELSASLHHKLPSDTLRNAPGRGACS